VQAESDVFADLSRLVEHSLGDAVVSSQASLRRRLEGEENEVVHVLPEPLVVESVEAVVGKVPSGDELLQNLGLRPVSAEEH